MDGPTTEIRTFYSIREIREIVETEISQHKALLEDYSQWLGTLLRNPESSRNPEWAKRISELQKILRSSGRKSGKKEGKSAYSSEWVEFKDLMLCADEFGEVEIIFEAVEELKNKLERLEKARNSLAELERYGFGKNVVYIVYLHEGVPKKIAVKPKKTVEDEEKFKFVADFSVVKQI
ncbi:MAG: hypothetical protein NZ932_05695 [Candidatus Bathyarchaeota archaeon]|nr:hypothetical protein [Candidatus Bathyarchaeota archaeon]